jgi:hypothetical protein
MAIFHCTTIEIKVNKLILLLIVNCRILSGSYYGEMHFNLRGNLKRHPL